MGRIFSSHISLSIAAVWTRSIPFKISAGPIDMGDEALREFREFKKMVAASDRPELTLDEINEEIRLTREEMAAREKQPV